MVVSNLAMACLSYETTRASRLHLVLVVLVFCISSEIISSFAELQKFDHAPKDDGSISFLVVGDWGRRGFYNQSKVALQVNIYIHTLKIGTFRSVIISLVVYIYICFLVCKTDGMDWRKIRYRFCDIDWR